MSYIDITGRKPEMGQYIDVRIGNDGSVDIFLSEGRVHIDEEDANVLRKMLFELKEI